MKKIVLFAIITLFLVSNSLWAKDITNNIGIGVRSMWLQPKNQEYFEHDAELEAEAMFGGTLTYGVTRWFSMEIAFDSSLETILMDKILDVKVADVRVYPLTFSGQLRYVPPYIRGAEYYTWIVPYATFGFGRYFVDSDVTKEFKEHEVPPGVTKDVEVDMDDAWGGHVGGGFDIFIHKNIAFNFEFRYFWAESDLRERTTLRSNHTVIHSEERSGEIDLDSWMLGVGIKFYFGLTGR